MAIAGIPSNFFAQQGNRQVWLTWDIAVGATSYEIQRSIDGISYADYASVAVNNYLDTAVVSGSQYWYQVSSVNVSGASSFTSPQSIVPTPTAEMSLGQIRLMAQQKSDLVNSQFVTLPEWNNFINLAMYELYDLLITVDEEYFVATPAQFSVQGVNTNQTYLYPLPDGVTQFTNGIDGQTLFVPSPFYKLKGVDLSLNTAQNAWVTINKFNFQDRNTFVYPNSSSAIYGVFNLRYRLLGSNMEFIPTPSGGQNIRLWYIPRLPQLLKDTDITTVGISGWLDYVITRAAKYALDKEESDTTKLDTEIAYLKDRIESTAVNRDTGEPDTISDIRKNWTGGGSGFGYSGPNGGF